MPPKIFICTKYSSNIAYSIFKRYRLIFETLQHHLLMKCGQCQVNNDQQACAACKD